jgi:Right handed beta helix region
MFRKSTKIPHHIMSIYSKTCLLFIGFVICFITLSSYKCVSVKLLQNGTTFYIDPKGNDSNNGTSISTPWKSIDKINASIFKPGDVILFKCGSEFNGSIQIKQSGSENSPITFDSYGIGYKPIISGFVTLFGWKNIGNGIWETSCPGAGSTVNLVTINGKLYAMGRTPNANTANNGYLTFQSHIGNNTIIDHNSANTINWTGAELVVRKTNFLLDRGLILSQNNNNIVYKNSDEKHSFYDGYGYFIQNDPRTLDQFGEWYFNPRSKTLQVYFGDSNPQSNVVKVSNVENLVSLINNNYITINNIAFEGANSSAFLINNGSNITIEKNFIKFSGHSAVDGSSANLTVLGNTIDQTEDIAIESYGCSNAIIKDNLITNTGLIPGMGNLYDGIFLSGDNSVVESNSVINTGYNGIQFYGNNVVVKNNFINNFTVVLDDGAGIFTSTSTFHGRQIINNIVLNGVGAAEGVKQAFDIPSEGIYVDADASDIIIANNTVAHVAGDGIKVHNAHNITVKNNTLFDNKTQLLLDYDATGGGPVRNVTVNNNELFRNKDSEYTLVLQSINDDIDQFGTIDKNFFAEPFNKDGDIITQVQNKSAKVYDLSKWKAISNNDINSKKVTIALPPYSIKKIIGPNLIPNGTYNNEITGTSSYSKNNNLKILQSNDGRLDGGALQVNIAGASNKNEYNIVTIGSGKLIAHKNYILRFSLVGNSDNDGLGICLRKAGAPYNALTDQQIVDISSTPAECELLFSPYTDENNSCVVFTVFTPKNYGTFWLNNVSLHQADINSTNPDSYTRFIYNETSQIKSVPLDGSYQDVKGDGVINSISLAPHTSAILIKTSAPQL